MVSETTQNRRRKPDPVKTIVVASFVSLGLAALGWAAQTTASNMSSLRHDIDSHERDDAGKWGEMNSKVNYLVDGVKELRSAAIMTTKALTIAAESQRSVTRRRK